MHENIKFTVKLSQAIAPIKKNELIRLEPIDFSPKDDSEPNEIQIDLKNQISDWQPIMSDIKYGTHHTLYAKFQGTKKQMDSEDYFELQGIQLYLQNFTGPISIGFNDAKIQIKEEELVVNSRDLDIRFPKRKQFILSVGLAGLANHLDDFLRIDEDEFRRADLPKEDNKLFEHPLMLRDGDTLHVDAWFSPAAPAITRIYDGRNALKDTPIVDEIFMERLGEDVVVSKIGLVKLKWINKHFEDIVTATQLEKVKKSVNREEIEFEPTLDDGDSDYRPCKQIYSKLYIE